MQSLDRSKARLRTRTGCLDCRKRRKKCDERHPRCGGCSRSSLHCTWPTPASQPADGRRRRNGVSQEQEDGSNAVLSRLAVQRVEHLDLYRHFATAVVPRLVRQSCLPESADLTHMLQLGLDYPPLMAVMVGIAALDLGTVRHDRIALESYHKSLQSLRHHLARDQDRRNADGLLATTICLCLFENLRSDVPPSIGQHATAAGVLLTLRPTQTQGGSRLRTVFERICAESFLFHSTLMMLFDPCLDALYRINQPDTLARFFPGSAVDDGEEPGMHIARQPVLDASYDFFFLIANVTRLSRIGRPLNEDEARTWMHLQTDLQRCKEATSPDLRDDPGRMLYVLGLQILLSKVHPALSATQIAGRIQGLLETGLLILHALDMQRFLLGYLLWPLTVLGSVAVEESERYIIREKVALLAQLRRGQAVRIHNRLEVMWASPGGEKATKMLQQLRMLVEGV